MRILKIICIFSIAFLFGCTSVSNIAQPRYNITIDSLASPSSLSKKTYMILPGNEGVKENDLQFQEFAGHLMRVLDAKGYNSAGSAEEADVVIFLAYGIGDPRTHHYSYRFPTWGTTGYSSATSIIAKTDGDKTTYRSITTYMPNYGITGYDTYLSSRTTYLRFATITAYDYESFKNSEEEIQLWKTTITSAGASDDLRRAFPVLIAASEPYLATDTGHKIYIFSSENDYIFNPSEKSSK